MKRRLFSASEEREALPRELPAELRREYLEHETDRITGPARAAIAVAISIVALFGIRDWIVAPHTAHVTTVLRGASFSLGLLACLWQGPPRQRRALAMLFMYGLLLSHSMVISMLPLGLRYQLTSLLILPLGASLFVPEPASLYRLQTFTFVAVQLGLWYQSPPRLDVVAAESSLVLTTFVTYLLGTMTIRARQRQFLLERRLREEAQRDDLTGLYNRRHLERAAQEELRRALRFHRTLSVIVVDIDKFKSVNDTHGHAAGDLVIRATARCLLDSIRDCDLLARYGGEEFVVLLPETELAGAMALAERLRTTIEAERVSAGEQQIAWTVSCGVTEVQESDRALDAVLARADACLYMAKNSGRNRSSSTPIRRPTEPPPMGREDSERGDPERISFS